MESENMEIKLSEDSITAIKNAILPEVILGLERINRKTETHHQRVMEEFKLHKQKTFFSIKEFSERHNVHINTVRHWIRTGVLIAERQGKQYAISLEQEERFLNRGKQHTIDHADSQDNQ